MSKLLLAQIVGDVCRLRLNDSGTRNSLSLEMIAALLSALRQTTAKVVIISAEGPVFCSGHNLREITQHRQDEDHGAGFFRELFAACSELMLHVTQMPAAVIAEVDGLASAAGCQLVASCDLAVASDKASFCTPGVNIGLFCSTPSVALSRAVDRKHAMEMLLTGDVFSAADAFRMGLVNSVVSQDRLSQTTAQLAEKISRKSTEAIRVGKKGFSPQLSLPVGEAYTMMAELMIENLLHDDAKEGISAFLNKRAPAWPRS